MNLVNFDAKSCAAREILDKGIGGYLGYNPKHD